MESEQARAWQRSCSADERASYHAKGWWRRHTHLDDILGHCARSPDKVAIVAYLAGQDKPEQLSYRQLRIYIDRCASALIELGVKRGDVVALQVPNGWECTVLGLAAMRVGAIPNFIPIIYRELQVSFMLQHAKARVYVVPPHFRGFDHAALARKFRDDIPTLEHVAVTRSGAEGLIHFESFFLDPRRDDDATAAGQFDDRRLGPDEPSFILYTSGTTGVPKAVVHTDNSAWSAERPIAYSLGLTGDDVCFMASTMGHFTGSAVGTLLPLSQGQKVVYQDLWDARRMLDSMNTEGLTWTLSSTAFAVDLIRAQRESRRRNTTLRGFICGGAPIPPQTVHDMKTELGVEMPALWGATEFGICTVHPLGTPPEQLAGSDGFPVPWMQVRIVDDDLRPVTAGEPGRLQVRGPGLFLGYMHQPELTEAIRTSDDWYDTGDVGRLTDHGGIRICGRTKDLVIRGGENVPVVEVENELLKHPKVSEVAVVAVPDARLGELGCAVVVPTGDPPTLAELQQYLESVGMAKPFWPERLELVKELPRTPIGKIQKFVLRDRLWAGVPLEG
ncbi:MAG TPA: AMP-binding protein [Vicinamibacterales bacterium]|nr:AMP-binding protein [Vicinamibacterales bacterium]